MFFKKLFLFFICFRLKSDFVRSLKFNAETFSSTSVLANEGKIHMDSLASKTNFSNYGSCWKNAITDLQVGCKFLTENIQKDLALKLTDCFLQTAGYEPVKCQLPISTCLQKLSDRAFNAYTEFFTHTHSICYFLQNQIWQEETEKTVNKLSSTSMKVSERLLESERMQHNLLNYQKESLVLQSDLLKTSRGITNALNSSQNSILAIMEDYKVSTSEQKELLHNVFKNFSEFRLWVINEITWFGSTVFFVGALISSFILTSVSRVSGARIYVLFILSLNFLFERYLCSIGFDNINNQINLLNTTSTLNEFIWLVRKFCVFLSVMIIIYTALSYCDYNVLNYKLLLEIKNQNLQILKNLNNNQKNNDFFKSENNSLNSSGMQYIHNFQNHKLMHKTNNKIVGKMRLSNAFLQQNIQLRNNLPLPYGSVGMDQPDDGEKKNIEKFEQNHKSQSSLEKSNISNHFVRSSYNLRSHAVSKV